MNPGSASTRGKDDICWRKAGLAAHLIWRARRGLVTARDRRLGAALKGDPEVTNRLIDQALAARQAKLRRGLGE